MEIKSITKTVYLGAGGQEFDTEDEAKVSLHLAGPEVIFVTKNELVGTHWSYGMSDMKGRQKFTLTFPYHGSSVGTVKRESDD